MVQHDPAWLETLELLGLPLPEQEMEPPLLHSRQLRAPPPTPPQCLHQVLAGLAGSNSPQATNPLEQRKQQLGERRKAVKAKKCGRRQGRGKKKAKSKARAPRKKAGFRKPSKRKDKQARKKAKVHETAAAAAAGSPPSPLESPLEPPADAVGAASPTSPLGLSPAAAAQPPSPATPPPQLAPLVPGGIPRLPRRPGAEVGEAERPPTATSGSSAATGSNVAAADRAAPGPATPEDQAFRERLQALGVPVEAWPQAEIRGKHSYTVKVTEDCTIEVQLPMRDASGKKLRAGCFLLKKPKPPDGCGRSVPWLGHGGVDTAWAVAKRRAGLHEAGLLTW